MRRARRGRGSRGDSPHWSDARHAGSFCSARRTWRGGPLAAAYDKILACARAWHFERLCRAPLRAAAAAAAAEGGVVTSERVRALGEAGAGEGRPASWAEGKSKEGAKFRTVLRVRVARPRGCPLPRALALLTANGHIWYPLEGVAACPAAAAGRAPRANNEACIFEERAARLLRGGAPAVGACATAQAEVPRQISTGAPTFGVVTRKPRCRVRST